MSFSDSPVKKLSHALFHRKLETKTLADGGKREKILDDWNRKLEAIHEYVRTQRTGEIETRGRLRKLVVFVPLHLLIRPMFSEGTENFRNRRLTCPSANSYLWRTEASNITINVTAAASAREFAQ
jgi:hypothetical protein